MITAIKFLACFLIGLGGHLLGRLIDRLEFRPPEANRPVFYLLSRYIVGAVMLLIGQFIMLNREVIEKRLTPETVLGEITKAYFS